MLISSEIEPVNEVFRKTDGTLGNAELFEPVGNCNVAPHAFNAIPVSTNYRKSTTQLMQR